ncbi:hypothetical protein SB758_38970, partial [Burkholderia sp. SIMBA_013]
LSSIPGTVSKLSGPPDSCVFAPRCPFAEETCRRLPQALRGDAAGNSVRCWKAEALAGTPWPEEATTASRLHKEMPARSAPLVQV